MAFDRRCTFLVSFVIFLCICHISGKPSVIDLDEDNWHQMLEGEWMVEFFAPWCPACKALKPTWKDFASWSDDLGISVGQVDVTTSPGLSGRFMVTALPTIYHVKDGIFRQYRGARVKEEFMSYVEEKRWESVEEVSAWKSPASLQMSFVAQFFKLSMVLRGVHSVLVEGYGLPTWGSYLVFALTTILIGALLGLILVCIIDFMFPPKAPGGPSPFAASASLEADDDEDLVEDSQVKEEGKVNETKVDKDDMKGSKVNNEEAKDLEGKELENEAECSQDEEGINSQGEDEVGSNSEVDENDAGSKSSPEVRRRRPRKAD